MYNRGQEYERRPLSPEGDRCEWFGVTDDVAVEVASAFDPSAVDRPHGPFALERVVSPADLYVRQRALVRRLRRGSVDALAVEEEALSIIAAALRHAHGQRVPPLSVRRAAARRRADLAEAARAELQRTPNLNRSIGELAAALATSPFHLCRVLPRGHRSDAVRLPQRIAASRRARAIRGRDGGRHAVCRRPRPRIREPRALFHRHAARPRNAAESVARGPAVG